VRGDVDGLGRTRLDALDGSDGAHNPKVGGSNPPPATKNAGQGRSERVGPSAAPDLSHDRSIPLAVGAFRMRRTTELELSNDDARRFLADLL
jgi:hypothetical protein